ncbi:flagellar basal body-associated FliL family protein [Sandaracinobacteroides hominis]|uniref:flagellar basal body-associated FliL family protein n=1 Tax=Sandaracinobacteroides hominis TaxID=2780086 RepID=UPI0018F7734B|nr:flagellar basal body-associated FliL family protein [Sandaracinobacteroides hominis]
MAEAAAAESPKKKGLLARLMLPLALLLLGSIGGVAGAMFLPTLMPVSHAEKTPPKPQVAPLEYVEIDNNFTANLRDTGRFVQVRIAISTQGGAPVVEAVQRHKPAIVAAVLSILADSSEEDVQSTSGREALARRMRMAINDVLQRKSGIAGIDDVFLVNFVLQ